MNLIINSKFRPFSYQEFLHPAMLATQAHQEAQNAYGQLESEAAKMEILANSQQDQAEYQRYKSYAEELRKHSDQLATNGLDYQTRNNLLKMKTDYVKNIYPIEKSLERREMLTTEQRKARAQDHTVIFDFDAANTGLSEFISNPNLSYNSISGKVLAATAGDMAAQLAQEITSGANAEEWQSVLGGQYYERAIKYGLSSGELMSYLANNQDNPLVAAKLKQISDIAMATTGVDKWRNKDEVSNQLLNNVNWGLFKSIGTTEIDNQADRSYVNPLEWERHRLAMSQATNQPPQEMASPAIVDYQDISIEEVDAEDRARLATVNELGKYFMSNGDGTYTTTKEWDNYLKGQLSFAENANDLTDTGVVRSGPAGGVYSPKLFTKAFVQDEVFRTLAKHKKPDETYAQAYARLKDEDFRLHYANAHKAALYTFEAEHRPVLKNSLSMDSEGKLPLMRMTKRKDGSVGYDVVDRKSFGDLGITKSDFNPTSAIITPNVTGNYSNVLIPIETSSGKYFVPMDASIGATRQSNIKQLANNSRVTSHTLDYMDEYSKALESNPNGAIAKGNNLRKKMIEAVKSSPLLKPEEKAYLEKTIADTPGPKLLEYRNTVREINTLAIQHMESQIATIFKNNKTKDFERIAGVGDENFNN